MNLVRMPGIGCRFYVYGHCIYEEVQNPGYDATCICTVLKKLESQFEDFVDRAEAFGIEPLTAAMIWPRFGDRICVETICSQYAPDSEKRSDECRYRYDNACILLFPTCSGRCSRFEPGSHLFKEDGFFHS
ncbi:hypothetical protein ACTVJH_10660 [Desulfoplanes sp. PS50]